MSRLRAATSLLLLPVGLAAAVAWAWSYSSPAVATLHASAQRALFLESTRGRIVLIRHGFDEPLPETVSADLSQPRAHRLQHNQRPWAMSATAPLYSPRRLGPRRLGFGAGSIVAARSDAGKPRLTYRLREVMFPHWLIVLLSMPLPAWWLLLNRRSRAWATQGRCRACGYDLRESPKRCPECGRPTNATQAASQGADLAA